MTDEQGLTAARTVVAQVKAAIATAEAELGSASRQDAGAVLDALALAIFDAGARVRCRADLFRRLAADELTQWDFDPGMAETRRYMLQH